MTTEVRFPKFGLTMTEGTLQRWLKVEGDAVQQGEPLYEIENDKAVLEVEAPASGVLLKILVTPGEVVPVGQVIGVIGQAAEQPPLSGATVGRGTAERVKVSPVARRLADEAGLDLSRIQGTGPQGRITKEDVEQALTAAASASGGPGPGGLPMPPTPLKARERLSLQTGPEPVGKAEQPALAAGTPGEEGPPAPSAQVVPFSGVRRVIAERMAHSAHTTAAVTMMTEADATELVRLRESLKAAMAGTDQPAPTYNDLLVKLVALALVEHPALNARLVGDEIHQFGEVHLGLAVDTDRGLIVPVIRHADRLSLGTIAATTRRLIDLVQRGQSLSDASAALTTGDLQGSTFTITNLGSYEVTAFTPIINPPECAVLGVGQIAPGAIVRDGEVVIRSIVTLSLTFDHRLVDGAPAARFLQRVKHLVENPVFAAL